MSGTLGRWMRRLALGTVTVIVFCVAVVAVLTARVTLTGEQMVPAGMRRNTALYVRMRDGVQIAVDVWLPADLRVGARVPVLMRTTRYWRADRMGWGLRALVALHRAPVGALTDPHTLFFNQKRFAVLEVDARGSGASSGARITEYSPDEIADLGEVAGWAAAQPWANGRVGTFGVSYDGNTAELSAVPNNPAVRAVAPLYDDFDTLLGLAHPGGVYERGMIQGWSDLTGAMDRNDLCRVAELTGWKCRYTLWLVPGIKPVDADADGKVLAEYVAERHNPPLAHSMGGPQFRDDNIDTPKGPINMAEITPFGLRKQIESSGAAMMVWCGWLDAGTCDGSLSRFLTFKNPQQVIIGAFSHGGGYNVDPFLEKHSPPDPPREEQNQMLADFFDRVLRKDPPERITSSVRYYTMGERQWHTTAVWPPAGLATRRYYFASDHELAEQPPADASGSDSYTVNFSATTGEHTRWHTQLGGGDVIYPDRATEDKKLLTYTGTPLASDVEITGAPVVSLELSSTQPDGALHVYLEDVSPEGRVTYVTEGEFRVVNRKITSGPLPYTPFGPPHSYLRADAEPLTPGEPAEISFALFSTSVVLRRGHRIRVALAGADASMFERIPAGATPTLTVYRGKGRLSYVDLPMKNR